ncbi:MAG: LytTR family DNA-binding domain-containing protein [Bacteroidota bacterium]
MYKKKISCLAVDYEPQALDRLEKYISAVPLFTLAGTCNNSMDAFSMLNEETVDLLFVEIKMPGLSGSELIKTLKKPPRFIFTSSSRRFAMDGFELNAIDYLLKPISFERFLAAVNKVSNSFNNNISGLIETGEPREKESLYSYFKVDRKTLKISMDDILYFESQKDYIKVVTKNRTILTRQSISSLQSSLPKNLFVRIHRSFIVAFKNIDSYKPETIGIAKYELPVSRLYRHEVESMLHQ